MPFDQLLYLCLPFAIGAIGFIMRTHMQRIDNIEKTMESRLTEQQTRQILADKLEPVKETLDDVQAKLDKLYDLLLK